MNSDKALFKLAIVICLGFYAVTSYSIALTKAELKPPLNQHFDVKIALLTDQLSEFDDLKILLSHSNKNNVSRYKLKYEMVKSELRAISLKITTYDFIRESISNLHSMAGSLILMWHVNIHF